MMATTYKSIDVDGLSIFYREAGRRDAPTLLLLQPPVLVVWGRYDPSFQVAEAEAFRRWQ